MTPFPSRCSFFLEFPVAHLELHPFPTRRSSDLGDVTRHARDVLEAVRRRPHRIGVADRFGEGAVVAEAVGDARSEEHTSELQSHVNLVCRLLLEKKKTYELQSRPHLECRLLLEN